MLNQIRADELVDAELEQVRIAYRKLPLIPMPVRHRFYELERSQLDILGLGLTKKGFSVSVNTLEVPDENGVHQVFFELVASRDEEISLHSLRNAAHECLEIAQIFNIDYERLEVDIASLLE